MTFRLGAFAVSGILTAAALVACSSGNNAVASKYVATASVGVAGGTLTVTAAEGSTVTGTSIVIPPNALKGDVTIQIGVSNSQLTLPSGARAAGPVIDFEPSGTRFALPVTITIPTTATAIKGAFVEAVEADGSTSELAVTSISGGLATFHATGFTDFGVATGEGCAAATDCAAGQICANGACVTSSDVDASACGTSADCPAGMVCVAGVCAASSETDACVLVTCAEAGVTCGTISDGCGGSLDCGTCADAGADASACGTSADCPAGMVCVAGVCAASSETDACVPLSCASAGVGCGTIDDGCGGSLDCGDCGSDAGADATACPGSETDCAGTCVDVETDPSNCGACGMSCAVGQTCSAGACAG